MLKSTILGLFAASGLAGAASAAMPAMQPFQQGGGAIVRVAEGCGPDGWRNGLDGRCHPLGHYTHGYPPIACPAGWHIGPQRGACWPNR